MSDIYTITDRVKDILTENRQARNSDNYLYCEICRQVGNAHGIDIDRMSMPRVILHLKELGLPSFETVSRARRKVVEQNPNLAGDDDIEAMRTLNEEEFRAYARKVIV